MTAERVYLTVAEVVAIHHYQIEEYGGESGLLNQGALESAVFRPQTGYYNDLSEETAALLESLVNNHPFVDGNKRVGFAAAHTFLLMNGFDLDISSKAAFEFFCFCPVSVRNVIHRYFFDSPFLRFDLYV